MTIRIGDWVEVYDRGRLQERGPVTHLMPVPDGRVMVFVERRGAIEQFVLYGEPEA